MDRDAGDYDLAELKERQRALRSQHVELRRRAAAEGFTPDLLAQQADIEGEERELTALILKIERAG